MRIDVSRSILSSSSLSLGIESKNVWVSDEVSNALLVLSIGEGDRTSKLLEPVIVDVELDDIDESDRA